jgi:riboflavin kinase / FMN adenylyltransferase
MELIRGLYDLREEHRNCVLTIGNFDGVHRGHQKVIQQLEAVGTELKRPVMVMIFEPQPLEFFSPEKAQARLTRLREKLIAFHQYGVERVLVVQFNQAFAALSPEQFIKDYLVSALQIKYLVVGDDFRFGHHREGDFSLLKQAGEANHFQVARMDTVLIENRRVSSTWVREALAQGDLNQAELLLGRPYSMCGRVAYGDQLGRKLGFPTANIYLHRHLSPVLGIYAVKVYGLADKPVLGVANVGNRPTVGGTRSLLEVYLFDFDKNIYGQYVRVDFLKRFRDEERYDSLDILKEQIAKDVVNARQFFGLK